MVVVQDVLSTGNKEILTKDDTFLQMGPKMQLEIFPLPPALECLSFLIKYEYLEGISGEPEDCFLFESAMKYQHDRKGHVSLDLSYRNGNLSLTKEAIDILSIGRGVKL